MKKISTLALCLMLLLTLTACAAIGRYTGAPQPTLAPEATLAPAETSVPEQSTLAPQPTLGPEETQAALGNAPANLSAGGRLAMGGDGALYLALEDGVYVLPQGGALTKLSGDRAKALNFLGGSLYYIAMRYAENESGFAEQTGAQIVRLSPDGARQVLAAEKPVGSASVFDTETGLFSEWTQRVGYGDLCLAGRYAYFLSDNERPGAVKARASVTGQEAEVDFSSEQSVYRLHLETLEVEEIVKDVGSGRPHLATDGQHLYVVTSYENPFYAYPFVTFRRYDMDGGGETWLLPEDYNPNAACGYTSDRGSFTEIVDGIFPANGALFVEASDSEGDFPDSRLMCVVGGEYQKVADETYYVRTVDAGEGRMVFFTAPDGIQYEQDEEGVIVNEYVRDARLILGDPGEGEGKTLLSFDRLERFNQEFSRFETACLGGEIYVLTDAALYRVGGGLEKLCGLPA